MVTELRIERFIFLIEIHLLLTFMSICNQYGDNEVT